MGAVGYTSTVADRDFYAGRDRRSPGRSRSGTTRGHGALPQQGLLGALLERVVATITANREKWVDTILEEERHLHPVGTKDVMRSSVVITVATLVGHLIPLFPFLFLATTPALVLAIVLSAVVLFGVGAYQAITRVGSWWKQGPRMVLIGLGAAALGYLIGRLFNASGG
jgi:VIT1/CCC1 family predicted Fe2+/Mn2+ transporter